MQRSPIRHTGGDKIIDVGQKFVPARRAVGVREDAEPYQQGHTAVDVSGRVVPLRHPRDVALNECPDPRRVNAIDCLGTQVILLQHGTTSRSGNTSKVVAPAASARYVASISAVRDTAECGSGRGGHISSSGT
jgi:hypothetical protein